MIRTMPKLKRTLLASPKLVAAAGKLIWLIGQSNDPYRFIYYCKQGDIDRAFETLDMPDEEAHEIITEIRTDAEAAARASSIDFEGTAREDVYQ